jgi:hypothetical protein
MFRWLKERREKAASNEFFKTVPDILARYGELHEKYPGAYLDEWMLPVDKPSMKRALKIGWLIAKTDEQREWMKIGWTLLQNFQSGIGDVPLQATAPDITSPKDMANFERWLEFAKKGQIEDEANQREKDAFIGLTRGEQMRSAGLS